MKEGGDGETRDREVSLPIHKPSQDSGPGQFVGWEKDRDRGDVSSPSPIFSAGVPFPPALLAANTQAALQAALMASLAAARQNYPINSGIPLLSTPGVPPHTPSAGINSYASLHTLVNTNPSLLSAAHREALLSTWSKIAQTTVTSLGSHNPSGYPTESGIPSGKSINSSNQTGNNKHNSNLPPISRSHSDVMNVALAHLGAELAAGYPSPEGYPTGPKSPTAGSSPASNNSSGGLSSSSSIKQDGKRQGSRDVNSREKVFVCKVCNRCFGYKHVLQNHERTHTGEKPFECKECHKRFTRDHHLKTHMRLHTGEKPYHCTHCERQFVQVANLRRHLRVHTGERPYACELCTSRFSDSNQLKAHMLIHKGEKPFQCPKCLGRFRRRHHLMHHKCPNEDVSLESANMGRKPKLSDDEDEVTTRIMDLVDSPQTVVPEIEKKRERKLKDPHKVIRLSGVPVATITSSEPLRSRPTALPDPTREFPVFRGLQPGLPEQTEPEDLSMNKRNIRYRRLSGLSHSSGGENDFSDGTYSEGDAVLDDIPSESEMANVPTFRVSKNGDICVETTKR